MWYVTCNRSSDFDIIWTDDIRNIILILEFEVWLWYWVSNCSVFWKYALCVILKFDLCCFFACEGELELRAKDFNDSNNHFEDYIHVYRDN